MGNSGTSLGVCPINRTRVWSLELCYEVVTAGSTSTSTPNSTALSATVDEILASFTSQSQAVSGSGEM